MEFNGLYKSDNVRNAVRSLSDYCKLQSLDFLIEMPQHLPQTGSGWKQRISCTSEMEGPVNMVHAQLESHITVIFLTAFLH